MLDGVNMMAANVANEIRAIQDVANEVTATNPTQGVDITDARGEFLYLNRAINAMASRLGPGNQDPRH